MNPTLINVLSALKKFFCFVPENIDEQALETL